MKRSFNLKLFFSSSFKNKLARKTITPRSAFIFAGLASTIWFLMRVIPKPSRAAYPCMRAAAPIMSSFVIWTLSIIGMGAFYKKAKTNFSKSKYLASGLFVLAFLATMAMFQGQNASNIFAKPATPGVNAVIGTAKGIFPGRVAWTYAANAAKWTGSGYFWASGNSQTDYNASFTAGIKSLSGGSDDATSWDLMFKWFNGTHGRTGTGYVPGDKIAIKINQNNTAYSGTGGGGMNANPYACVAIVASLVNANVPQADIWIGDPSRAVTDNIFNLIHTAYPDVNVVDYFGNNGRKTTGCTTGDYPQYGKMSTCFATARYLVSLPILKGHPGQSFSFGAKNWFGAGCISNNYVNNPHPASGDFESTYMTSANIGGKVILWCMDASYPSVDIGSTPSTNKGANFIMSLDGCAEESVSLDMWNMYYGKGFAGENYIDIAAAGGAGAHEHWNNNTNKQYTRNITPTANGIELVYVIPSNGPTVSISSPATGSSSAKGTAILISGTSTPESGKTITKVEVTAGTTPLTVTGTTSWSCSYTPATAGSLTITAKATSLSAATDTKSVTVTITEPVVLPAKVEAENYSAMYGIQTETTTDTGGGLNVGYTEVGDWMDYLVTVPSTGTYTIDFRVASGVATGKIELRNSAGTALATVSQTVAGDWQGWSTKTVTANLTAGTQTLKIYYTGAGLNINWFEVKTSSILSTITLTPATATTTVGQTQQFTAVGKDQNGTVMTITPTWTTTGGGTIISSGLLTATTAGGPFTVTATVGTISGTAQITVNPQVLSTITVTPATATLVAGQTQQYTAVGKDQNGIVMTIAPTWSTTGGGSISTSGLFTSTTAGGPFSVSATVGTITGTASVTVTPAPVLTTITLTPATATITVGQTQQFTAVGKDQNGTVMTITPTWSAYAPNGLFTATAEGGPFTVSATVGSVSGTAQVTVDPAPVSQTIQAENYATMFGVQTETTTDTGGGLNVGWIAAGDWMTYTVTIPQTGTYSANFRVSGWTATGTFALQNAANTTLTNVTVPNGGTGAYQVWSTVAGANTFQLSAGTQTLRIYATGPSWNINWFEIKAVEASVLTTITVSPATASIVTGSSQQFTAIGKDQFGAVMTITPTWSTNAPNGLFTGSTVGGPYTVTASIGAITGSASVTVTTAITTVTLNPAADAYVRGGTYAAINYGTTADLYVKSAPETDGLYTRKAYLQFSVAGITGVQNAVVRLYAGTVAAFSVKVNETTDAWTETAINWNNAPVVGNQIATTVVSAAGVYYEWNVTSYVQSQATGDGIVSLVFSDAATTNAQIIFNSKEATTNKPQLVVTSSGLKSANVNSDMQEITKKDVSIYPNPVTNNLNVDLTGNAFTKLVVVDLTGRVQIAKSLNSEQSIYNIDFSGYKHGVYFIKLSNERETIIRKVIKN